MKTDRMKTDKGQGRSTHPTTVLIPAHIPKGCQSHLALRRANCLRRPPDDRPFMIVNKRQAPQLLLQVPRYGYGTYIWHLHLAPAQQLLLYGYRSTAPDLRFLLYSFYSTAAALQVQHLQLAPLYGSCSTAPARQPPLHGSRNTDPAFQLLF